MSKRVEWVQVRADKCVLARCDELYGNIVATVESHAGVYHATAPTSEGDYTTEEHAKAAIEKAMRSQGYIIS